MSTTEELQKMVLQFKVSDLQSLLGFAGQNKNGRKTELQKKALHLIQYRKSVPLEMKVRNIYRQLVAEHAVDENEDDCFRSSFDKYNNCYSSNGYSNQSVSNAGFNSYNSRNYFPDDPDSYYDMWSRSNNGFPSYNSSQNAQTRKFDYSVYMDQNSRIPNCSELQNIVFKKLSFYKFKSCVIALTPMIPTSEHSDLFEYSLSFNLNQQQYSLINWAKKSGKELRYQIQLRICLLDNSLDFSQNFEIGDSLPLALAVKINDKNCQLPPAIPSTNKQGMLLKRMDAPINLTPQTRKNHANNLVINWSIESNKLYGLTIHLVEKYSSDELINELKVKGERDPEITKQYLSVKLNELCDDDIAATSLKLSLVCPLGKILMSLPVRATTCNHLQCFDGTLYIKMNEVKSTWQCPVCNKTCYYEDLFIDGYFANILRKENFNNVTDIQIEADGSVIPVIPKKRSNSSSDSAVTKKKLKRDDEPYQIVPHLVEKVEPRQNSLPSFLPIFGTFCTGSDGYSDDLETKSAPSQEQPKKNVVLVDLTETDSESEESPSNVPLNLKKNNDASAFSEVRRKKLPPVYDVEDS